MGEWLVVHAPNQWVQFAAGLIVAAPFSLWLARKSLRP